jgi:Asp-tRNA(Asn)/Glu-tRNA(Gln) amidotransferase A subunit family amidase
MLTELKLREVVKAVIARETTALEVTEAYLRKVEENEQFVQAWTFLDQDLARDQARRVDARLMDGALLAGVPLGIKDVFDTHDMPACYGSEVYRNNRPFVDAAVVAKARSLSAVILGKTVTTEFATFSPGKTRNPHRSSAGAVHTPGGSSSGSAAAVAAGMVPAAIGTQTAASIIRPAAYCGVVGYKPTFGMLMTVGA